MPPTGRELAALARARELAMTARGRVSPNPLVGAVVVDDGRVVGEGWHEGPGTAHAEVMALRDAGDRVRGATVVCTLEPCSHFGRTPPCTDALLAAGVARVVVGCLDPLERTRGQGVRVLDQAGVEVALAAGDDARACRELNAAFITWAVLGRPHVTLKLATSLDGRIATAGGESRWITGEPARARVHRWRADHDAVAVGLGTALADDPLLTARGVRGAVRQPARVVWDTTARLPLDSALVRGARDVPVIVIAGEGAPADRVRALEEAGVEVLAVHGRPPDVAAGLQALGRRGIQSLFVEGGAELADGLLRARAVDAVRWFVAPMLIGGRRAPAALGGQGVTRLGEAPRLHGVTVERVGEDVLISGRLTPVPEVARTEGA
ncbi:MAG TPA: bifunctional diaminohydroxyphosphoribosylaminopyrimidine deaminase/5-amino-6-(5-phosphoribosylamino)uracil reductase RibD [Miltoncostaeaceae bacterium]|nr:bifunctional diaminohydroxyphosphoribosylaminopyrimidine deaminase/5-amino-6-(5-phosphoribosylamino)uracil reductase RibD [Miltoncostaeaceae bacterium]